MDWKIIAADRLILYNMHIIYSQLLYKWLIEKTQIQCKTALSVLFDYKPKIFKIIRSLMVKFKLRKNACFLMKKKKIC